MYRKFGVRYQFSPSVHASALPAGTGGREAERERALRRPQRVIPRGDLKRAEVAVAEIEVARRPDAGAVVRRLLAGQHV